MELFDDVPDFLEDKNIRKVIDKIEYEFEMIPLAELSNKKNFPKFHTIDREQDGEIYIISRYITDKVQITMYISIDDDEEWFSAILYEDVDKRFCSYTFMMNSDNWKRYMRNIFCDVNYLLGKYQNDESENN